MIDVRSYPDLVHRPPLATCEACVVIPARNEEHYLPHALSALAHQCYADHSKLDHQRYEVLVLCNNCTDNSVETVRTFAQRHPSFQLHAITCTLPQTTAHVGTARSMLMDEAARRLKQTAASGGVILSTDADTVVSPHWITETFGAIHRGCDAVGGAIQLDETTLATLDDGTRATYILDRRYQRSVAKLESLLDPLSYDPWPRHNQHFGASLACTAAIYERAGGMQPITPLEDVAFYRTLEAVGARFRHEPRVRVKTSGRTDGRAGIGLSWQLRTWRDYAAEGDPWRVESANFLYQSCALRGTLRRLWNQSCSGAHLDEQSLARSASTLAKSPESLRALFRSPAAFSGILEHSGYYATLDRLCPRNKRKGEISRELAAVQRRIHGLITAARPITAGEDRYDISPAALPFGASTQVA